MSDVTNFPGKVTAASLQEEARKEIIKERSVGAKDKIKAKLKQIEATKIIVANLERELEVLIEQVNAELSI